MNLVDIILLAIALGIDCLVVSFAQGIIFDKNKIETSLKLALIMGLFQGGMPIIGYVGTDIIYKIVVPFSKWVIFGIFFILGLKFIFDAVARKEKVARHPDLKYLLSLGLATSIDALVSGASLRLTETGYIIPCIIIGFASFIMSLAGFWTGNWVKNFSPKFLQIIGGVILIGLAVKAMM